jgi:hypothetical protein
MEFHKGLSEDVSSRGLAQVVDDHLARSINVGTFATMNGSTHAVTKVK